MIPDPDTKKAHFITPAVEMASTALLLGVLGGVAWYVGGFESSVIVILIAGFATAAAEISYSRNALALQLIAMSNLLILVAEKRSSRKNRSIQTGNDFLDA